MMQPQLSKYQWAGIVVIAITIFLSIQFGFLVVFGVAFMIFFFAGLYIGVFHFTLDIIKSSPKSGLLIGLISYGAITAFICYILFVQLKVLD
jgi:hypothetical protein